MGSQDFLLVCKQKIAEYFNEKKEKTDITPEMKAEDVYVVWYSKTLQNHKALLSTPVSDGMYYEVTYNGDKNELYFDAYKKWENIKFKDVRYLYADRKNFSQDPAAFLPAPVQEILEQRDSSVWVSLRALRKGTVIQ